MAKRLSKRHIKLQLPGILAALVVISLLLTSGGPRGVAVNSPAETPEPVLDLNPPADSPSSAALPPPATPQPEAVPAEPDPHGGLVGESAPVDDTYFENIAFLGDSRTEGFKLYSGLETGTYYHSVGATVESVFTKSVETIGGNMPLLDAMAAADYDKIYVMLGVNELGWSKTETFREQYAKVIDRLREDHPDTEIVIQSILPVSSRQDAKGSYVNNKRIRTYNDILLELAIEKECPYLNVAEAVMDEDNCLRSEWNSDGVHLNIKGCKAWLEYLRTHAIES